MHRIVTSDKTRVHHDNPKRRKSWGKSGHAWTSPSKPNMHGSKLLLCIWWDQPGLVNYELPKPDETITGDRYRPQLMCLSRAWKEKRTLYEQNTTKWFCRMTTLGHMLQNRWKPAWKRLSGKSYLARRIHQTFLCRCQKMGRSLVSLRRQVVFPTWDSYATREMWKSTG